MKKEDFIKKHKAGWYTEPGYEERIQDYVSAWVPIDNPVGKPNAIEFDAYSTGTGGILRWNDADGIGRAILAYEKGIITDIVVDKEFRRQGIANALLKEAKTKGVKDFKKTYVTEEGAAALHSFYEKEAQEYKHPCLSKMAMRLLAYLEIEAVEEIYELTYKYGWLTSIERQKGGSLPDKAYTEKARIESTLPGVLQPAIKDMIKMSRQWLKHDPASHIVKILQNDKVDTVKKLLTKLSETADLEGEIYNSLIRYLEETGQQELLREIVYFVIVSDTDLVESLILSTLGYRDSYFMYLIDELGEEVVLQELDPYYNDLKYEEIDYGDIEERMAQDAEEEYILDHKHDFVEWFSFIEDITIILDHIDDHIDYGDSAFVWISGASKVLTDVDSLKQWYWNTYVVPTTGSVERAVENMESSLQGNDIGEQIISFQEGLTAAHHNGLMADYILDVGAGGGKQILDSLSQGRTVNKWNKDLQRVLGYDPTKVTAQFLAQPPEPNPYKGILEYPGFHTTTSLDIAAMYALGKIGLHEDESGVHYVDDYPVIVALDMSQFDPETDYDAAEIVGSSLQYGLDQLIEDLEGDLSEENILNKAFDLAESGWETEPVMGNSAQDFLSENIFSHFNNPIAMLMEKDYFADVVKTYAETGTIPDQALMDAAEQFRYLKDVPESRVQAVYYVTPITEELQDYQMEDWDEEEVERKWPGFDIIGPDEAYGGYWNPQLETIWENKQLSFEGIEPKLEYHGTTYNRLLQAAPELGEYLTVPPTPYRGGE